MKGLIKRWASQFNFSSGPKSGSPSKVVPSAALTTQGIQPGSGQKASAEEMNAVLNLSIDNVEQTRLRGLYEWSEVASADYDTYMHGAIFNGGTGVVYVATFNGVGKVRQWTPSQVGTPAASDDFNVNGFAWASKRLDSNGLGSFLFAGPETNGIEVKFATAADPFVISSDTLASTSTAAMQVGGLAYDDVNEAVVGVTVTATLTDQVFFRFLDSGSAVAAASSGPSLPVTSSGKTVTRGQKIIAAGGGTALCVYQTTVSGPAYNFVSYSSTDGGDTWAATSSAPSGSDASISILSLEYVEDFIGLGPQFVAVIRESGAIRIAHTTDGSSWTNINAPTNLNQFADNAVTGAWALVLGDVILLSNENVTGIGVWDVLQNTGAKINPSFGIIERLQFDGIRVWCNSTSGAVLVSGPIGGAKSFTHGRLNE